MYSAMPEVKPIPGRFNGWLGMFDRREQCL